MSNDQEGPQRPRRIVVVGAGLAGVTAAFSIARRASQQEEESHCEVTIVDAAPAVATRKLSRRVSFSVELIHFLATESSFRNAGRFCPGSLALGPPKQAPSVTEVLTAAWLERAFLKPRPEIDTRMPFPHKMEVALSPGLALWTVLKFGRDATAMDRATKAHALLSSASCAAMTNFVTTALTPAAVNRLGRNDGTLYVYNNVSAFEKSRELLGLQRDVGLYGGEMVKQDEAMSRFPWLKSWKSGSQGSEVPGVFLAGDDHTADARYFTEGVEEAARKLGVKFRFNERVVRIEYDESSRRAIGLLVSENDSHDCSQATKCIPADDIVLACGFRTPELCPLGPSRIPIQPIRGFSIELHGCTSADKGGLPTVAFADYSCGGVQYQLIPFPENKMRLIGFADLVGLDAKKPGGDPDGPKKILLQHTRFVLPSLRWQSVSELWAGIRPMTPDNLPYVGKDQFTDNVWLCAGHGATGWTTSTGTAEVLAAQLVGGIGPQPPADLSAALDPNRFCNHWATRIAAFLGVR
eukprot:m.61135 g.61135  ORF g.61135 m.61135 type:complete len:523 (+) comp9543_c0_seq1:118-1686(+)